MIDTSSTPARNPSGNSTLWLIGATILAAVLNWIAAIARFQVNVPSWDQWDFFGPLFENKGWLPLFDYQHGPHRLGLGAVIDSWILEATGWDTRIESLWIVSLLIFSTLLALRLKREMSGKLSPFDAAIPVIVLSLSQWGSVISVPSVSHSVFALLLTLGACNTWLLPSPYLRIPLTGALVFLMIFSGFGLFAAALATVVLAISFARLAFKSNRTAATIAAIPLIIVLTGWGIFAHGYQFNPASEGYHFPHEPLFDYVRFLTLMLAHPLGCDSESLFSYIAGATLLMVGMVVFSLAILTWLLKRTAFKQPVEILILLIGSTFVFALFTAVGRIHLGITAGMASRYTTLLIPLWLGIYLWGTAQPRPATRRISVALVWLIALIPLLSLLNRSPSDWPGTAGISDAGRRSLSDSTSQKMAWVSAFLRSGNFQDADSAAGRLIHPAGESIGLRNKLDWLKQRNLSFFKPSTDPHAWHPWWRESRSLWLRTYDREEDAQWMADDCALWMLTEQDGFVNFQVVQKTEHLPDDSHLDLTHRNITGAESSGFLREIISLPVTQGEHYLTLRSPHGSFVAAPPKDTRRISFQLTDAWLTQQPAGVEWAIVSTEGKNSWSPRYRWRILSGFHGWEHPASFGWSDAELVVEVHSAEPLYLNVNIEKRYQAVDTGPVTILQPDYYAEISKPADHPSFSIPIHGSDSPTIIQIKNQTGAASPHTAEEKADTRPLALKLGHLSVSQSPKFPILSGNPLTTHTAQNVTVPEVDPASALPPSP